MKISLETKRDLWILTALACMIMLVFFSLADRSLHLPLLLATFLTSIPVGYYENACDRRERRRRRNRRRLR